jgi:hypothetical protein
MPHPVRILYPNLISQQNFRARTRLPAPIPGSRKHESTSRINVNSRYDATTMARDNSEGNRAVSSLRFGLCRLEVVDAQDIVGRTEAYIRFD